MRKPSGGPPVPGCVSDGSEIKAAHVHPRGCDSGSPGPCVNPHRRCRAHRCAGPGPGTGILSRLWRAMDQRALCSMDVCPRITCKTHRLYVRRPAHGPVHASGHHRAQHVMEPNCLARPNLVPVPRTFWNRSRSRQTLRGPLGTQHGRNVNGNARGRTGHRPHRRIHLYERADEGMPLCIGVALRPRRSDPAVGKPFRNRPRLGR